MSAKNFLDNYDYYLEYLKQNSTKLDELFEKSDISNSENFFSLE